jgi:hypothetical protein
MKTKCKICTRPLSAGQRSYCSAECAAQGRKLRRRVKRGRQRKCRRCRSGFQATRRGHVICSAACRQAEARERAARRDVASLVPLWALHRDLKAMGVDPPAKKSRLDLAAVERIETRRQRDELLRSAGIDPRPPRRQGRAIQPIQAIKDRLAKAVREEDYEIAAALRDELRGHIGATSPVSGF